MSIFSYYPYVGFLLLLFLIYAGYEDFKSRKIATVIFLVFDIGLLLYYLAVNPYLSILLIPLIGEYWVRKYSIIFYLVILFPLLLSPSILVISVAYSVLLMKVFSIIIKNFGRGDLKVLQTIAAGFPLYPHLPLLYSILPPVIPILMFSSIMGMFSGLFIYLSNRDGKLRGRFTSIPVGNVKDEYKYWIRGDRAVYKIPLVTFISISYAIIFILSLLRLV